MLTKLKQNILQAGLNYKKTHKPANLKELERFRIKPEDPHEINNSFFLGGHTTAGDDLTMRLGQRNGDEHELFVIYRRAADGLTLFQEKDHYSPEEMPLEIICEKEEELWRYRFDGYLRDAEGKRYAVKFDVLFTATLPIYDFIGTPEKHVGMVTAIARERWTGNYFKRLSLTSQNHYEQQGKISGTIEVEGEARTIDSWSAIRDRAMGKRVWDFMNCHIWLAVTTDEGDCLMFSLVSYPVMDSLFTGYHTIRGKKEYATLTGYRLMDYDHCDGKAPDHFKAYTEWSDGRVFIIEAQRDFNVLCTFDHGDYIFQESLGNMRINGLAARGNLEYGYNKNPERWGQYLPTDFATN